MFVKITHAQTKKAIKDSDLKISHTQKVHLFTISENLEYYNHIHPKLEGKGVYSFEWKNIDKTQNWKVWTDLVSANTKKQEYINFEINNVANQKITESKNLKYTKNGINFELSFDGKLEKNKDLTMKLKITDIKGKPFTKLEEIMGAYAHLVAFSGSNSNILHIHPLNTNLENGELLFHINFPEKTFIKLFAQVKIDNQDYFIPFAFYIK